ncbi:TPA: oligosaccharide flippase family protein, partial [Escherichia coli Ou:H7]|nr:oligosaccharide flippase family protein [Escherichia coli Ou:H7]
FGLFYEQRDVILVMFIGVIGNCLFPIYLFQGLELMRNIAWISICSKTLMTILTFLLVRNSGDIINAAIVLTLPLLIPGVIAHFYIKKEKIATLNKVDISSVFNELKESAPLFISQVSISFYTTFNTLILGYFYSPTMVGLYSAADKLRVAVQSCYIPIQQVIFPKMNKENGTVGHKLFKYGGPFLIVSFFGSILVFVFGQKLATMYLGEDFSSSAILFKWMSILLFVIAVAIVYGQWGLITLGKEKTLTKIYVTGAFLHLFYTIPLMEKYSIFGMLTSVIIT